MAPRGTADDTPEQGPAAGEARPEARVCSRTASLVGMDRASVLVCSAACDRRGRGAVSPRLQGVAAWRGTRCRWRCRRPGPCCSGPPPPTPCPPRTAATAPAPPPEPGHGVVRVTHSDPVRAKDVSATRGFLGRSSSVSSWFRLWLSDTFDPFQCTRCTKIERTRLVGVGDPSGRGPHRKRPVSHPCWLRGVLPSAHFLLIRSADSVLRRVAFARRPQRPHRRQLWDTSSLGCSSPAPRSAYAAQSPMACLRDERPQTVLSDPRS